MITNVKQVSIPVKNQEESLKFYTEKLGFEIVVDADFGEGQRWIELKIPSAETQIVLFTPKGHEDRIGTFSNVIFTCEDVEKSYQQMKNSGVEFTQGPKHEPWGTFCLFKDPDGNSFCLSSS